MLGLDRNGFRGPDIYTSILSSILKLSRFFVLKYAFKDENLDTISGESSGESSDESSDISGPENKFSGPDSSKPLLWLKALVNRFLIQGLNTSINWLLDLRSYGLKIARSTTSSGSIDWNGDIILFKNISFSIFDFRSFLSGLILSTRTILYEEILFTNSISISTRPIRAIPAIEWSQINDNPRDSLPDSSFLNNSRTKLGLENSEKWLYSRIATSPDLASRFSLPGLTLTWNKRKLLTYISSIQLFLEKLSILFLIGGGAAP